MTRWFQLALVSVDWNSRLSAARAQGHSLRNDVDRTVLGLWARLPIHGPLHVATPDVLGIVLLKDFVVPVLLTYALSSDYLPVVFGH